MSPSFAIFETSSIARGIEAADAMVKVAEVEILDARVIARGKYIILFTGILADVQSSMNAAMELAKSVVVDHFIIPNVHEQVIPAFKGPVKTDNIEAVGVIETKEVASTVFAADAAAKKANITLIEAKFQPGGKGLLTLAGNIGPVKMAVQAAIDSIQNQELLISHVIIPQVHDKIFNKLVP